MLSLNKVAVTGGLSCGKSSVCRTFQKLGASIISADEIVHQIISTDAKIGERIIKLLGPQVMTDHGIDRARMAQVVFLDNEKLLALEALLHPLVYREINKEYQKQLHLPVTPTLFVAEVPLLFESGGEKHFDFTVAVMADEEHCFQRYHSATGQNRKEFDRRMARQLPPAEKAKRADYIIMNNGSISDLKKEVEVLFIKLSNPRSP